MSTHPLLLFVFIMANLAITLGYAFVALRIVPQMQVSLLRTKIGGVGFFGLCGATHLGMVYNALFEAKMTFAVMSSTWPMVAIHLPQAVCVWLFVTGLYIEIGDWAPLRRDGSPEDE